MSRSALKKFSFFLFPLLACYLAVSLFYFFCDFYSAKFGSLIARFLGENVVVGEAFVSPFQGLRLKNVRLENEAGQKISADQVVLQFTFAQLPQRKVFLRETTFSNVTVQGEQGREIDTIEYLSGFMAKKPRPKKFPVEVIFDQGVFCFRNLTFAFRSASKDSDDKKLAMDICVDKKGNKLSCDGVVDYGRSTLFQQAYSHVNLPSRYLNFLLDLEILGKDVSVDQVKLYFKKDFLAGSGMVYDYKNSPKVDVKLYSSPVRLESMPAFRAFHPQGGEVTMVEGRLSGSPQDLMLTGEVIMPVFELILENERMSIEKVACNFRYNLKNSSLIIRELQGTMDNNLYFSAAGQVDNIFTPSLSLRSQLIQLPLPKTLTKDTGLVLVVQGKLTGGGLEGSGEISYLNTNGRRYFAYFKGLSVNKAPSTDSGLPLQWVSKEVVLQEKPALDEKDPVTQSFAFRDFTSRMRCLGRQTFLDDMSMSGYDGKLRAQGRLHVNQQGRSYELKLVLDNLNLNGIKITYPVYCEASGLVNGELKIDGKDKTNVTGFFTADNFKLSKLEPLDKIADFIGIGSIKEISGAQLASEFELSPDASTIRRFDLDSNGINLRSNFSIDSKEWLEGEVALSLPRKVLAESKIFKTLMAIARERNDFLDFVVHLSGYFWQLRTELVKSDLRDKLKEKVSVNVQRLIEQEANKAIDSTGP